MRFWAPLLLVAVAFAPLAPVAECAMPPRPSVAAPAAPADAASDAACCSDESACCATDAPADHVPSAAPADAPCCRATNAPVPAVPATALESSAPHSPLFATVSPDAMLAAVTIDVAHRVATTESPPGLSGLRFLSTNRLRL